MAFGPKMAMNLKNPDFVRWLVDTANEMKVQLGATKSEYIVWSTIKRAFAEADIVIGVWQDADEPYGVGILLLKGSKLLNEISANGVERDATMTALPCNSREQAIAVYGVFGDRVSTV
jgi:hypothetical protein